jgi:hypothetical protein
VVKCWVYTEQIAETNAGDCQADEASAGCGGALYAMVAGSGETQEGNLMSDADRGRVGSVREQRRSVVCNSE